MTELSIIGAGSMGAQVAQHAELHGIGTTADQNIPPGSRVDLANEHQSQPCRAG
jgi:3-hydroxyacyl-CoA dehydrogenase